MKRCLGSGRILPPAEFEPATPWSEVGSANRSATRTLQEKMVLLFKKAQKTYGLIFSFKLSNTNSWVYGKCLKQE